MNRLSSTNLFHFLKKKEWLLEILENMSFKPRYVLEEYPSLKETYLISMKCFCDIPLSSIKNHISKYGKFGIGFNKEFAYKHYISPVCYYYESSNTIFRLITMEKPDSINQGSLIPYFKYINSADKTENYYDEREWRYITGTIYDVTNLSTQEQIQKQDDLNSKITDKVVFNLEDIKYIFVDTENDKIEILHKINKMNSSEFNKDILKTKIITAQQIFDDF
jgi:hypothetical protein